MVLPEGKSSALNIPSIPLSPNRRPTNTEESWPAYSPVKREYKIFNISENGADIGYAPRFRHCAMWSHLLPKLRKMEGEYYGTICVNCVA